METPLWLQPQLNAIVFEHCNQAYGAFLLRSDYNRTMSRSIPLIIGFFILAFLSIRLSLASISTSSFADPVEEIEKVIRRDPMEI